MNEYQQFVKGKNDDGRRGKGCTSKLGLAAHPGREGEGEGYITPTTRLLQDKETEISFDILEIFFLPY